MRTPILICLFVFATAAFSQDPDEIIQDSVQAASLMNDIGFIRALSPPDIGFYYGFLHNNESMFAMKYAAFTKDLNHPGRLVTTGKNWHMGQVTGFKMYYEFESANQSFYGGIDMVLIQVNMKFTLIEDSTKYGGIATGNTLISGLYDFAAKEFIMNYVGTFVSGTGKWTPYSNPGSLPLNLFWTAEKPDTMPDGSLTLLDLHNLVEIKQNYSENVPVLRINWSPLALKPKAGWYKEE